MKKIIIIIIFILTGCTPSISSSSSMSSADNYSIEYIPTTTKLILDTTPIPFDDDFINIYKEGQTIYFFDFFCIEISSQQIQMRLRRSDDLYQIVNLSHLSKGYQIDENVIYIEKNKDDNKTLDFTNLESLTRIYESIEPNSIFFNKISYDYSYQNYHRVTINDLKYLSALNIYLEFLKKIKEEKNCQVITLAKTDKARIILNSKNKSILVNTLEASSFTVFYITHFYEEEEIKKLMIDLYNSGYPLFYGYTYHENKNLHMQNFQILDLILNGQV